mmetsp:Transcript_11661/g.25041  ORF Transcript_11661/g.25041 Transcript_11661/m.25041 type:complete len:90 (+) Transcript_11661:69-338(+)
MCNTVHAIIQTRGNTLLIVIKTDGVFVHFNCIQIYLASSQGLQRQCSLRPPSKMTESSETLLCLWIKKNVRGCEAIFLNSSLHFCRIFR